MTKLLMFFFYLFFSCFFCLFELFCIVFVCWKIHRCSTPNYDPRLESGIEPVFDPSDVAQEYEILPLQKEKVRVPITLCLVIMGIYILCRWFWNIKKLTSKSNYENKNFENRKQKSEYWNIETWMLWNWTKLKKCLKKVCALQKSGSDECVSFFLLLFVGSLGNVHKQCYFIVATVYSKKYV